MQIFDTKNYVDKLTSHYENYFGMTGNHVTLKEGPTHKLHNDFFVLEFPQHGFSAMLAEEYILIVPFVYHLQSGLNE